MKKSYLVVAGHEEILDSLREVLLKLKQFPSKKWERIWDFDVFQVPEWMLSGEHIDLAKYLKTLRAEETT